MQHASYLFDADVFVTADHRYAAALELVRPSAPVEFAQVARIPGAGSVVTAIAHACVRSRLAEAAMQWGANLSPDRCKAEFALCSP
jgi:hypothetical protein